MRLTKKTIILAIALVAIITGSVFGTIAYLTDTDEVTNQFTVGKVKIDVDEAKVNEKGELIDEGGKVVENIEDAARTEDDEEGNEGNTYPMIPGKEYTKDPTMTVLKDSESAYYRMMVTFTDLAGLREAFHHDEGVDYFNEFVPEYDIANWERYGNPAENEEDNSVTYEFRYKNPSDVVTSEGDARLPALFTTLRIPTSFDTEEMEHLKNMSINVVGHAIQTTGFEDDNTDPENPKTAEDAAWEAFDAQLAAKADRENQNQQPGGEGGSTPEGGEGTNPEGGEGTNP